MNGTRLASPSRPTRSTRRSDQTARVALLVTLGSETFFFGTLLAAYLYLRADQTSWPLTHAPLARLAVPGTNTLILLASALTAYFALRSVRKGRISDLVRWLAVTLALGLVFIGGQVLEYTSNGMQPGDQAFGGVFFTLMGFHALHLVAGILILGLALLRAHLGDFTARRHVAVQIGTWFWFYVVGVWVVLFSALYLV